MFEKRTNRRPHLIAQFNGLVVRYGLGEIILLTNSQGWTVEAACRSVNFTALRACFR